MKVNQILDEHEDPLIGELRSFGFVVTFECPNFSFSSSLFSGISRLKLRLFPFCVEWVFLVYPLLSYFISEPRIIPLYV